MEPFSTGDLISGNVGSLEEGGFVFSNLTLRSNQAACPVIGSEFAHRKPSPFGGKSSCIRWLSKNPFVASGAFLSNAQVPLRFPIAFHVQTVRSFRAAISATVTLSIAGSGQVISLNDTWWWNDSTQNNTYTGIASATNQGSLSTSGFTVGATSFTASVSNWNLSNSLAGLPSYIDHSGDFTVNFIFKNANGTTLDSDTISIDQFNGTFNSSGSTLHIPSFTITPGESLTAQAYQLQIRVRYANVLQ